ncbi:autophagy-related protein 13-domain-containing protein [Absidia repens]|uniref:Autophagy-related protein 13 n=1 Tax=Absidia repens TaxID=90262 RepID=A0A1X2I9H9_9FUNG|nr:autophagy-related protein 13-domain-containing protein [Absidia repens]
MKGPHQSSISSSPPLPSPATSSAPLPPSSSTSARNSKLDHIIQNFYTKTAQLIIQARFASDGLQSQKDRHRESKKLNKWFNIATEDIDLLRDELKYWRALATQSSNEEPPPMIINIYLDTSKLSQEQALIVVDDTLRRNRVDLNASQADTGAYGIKRILIESWVLTLNHPLPDFSVDLPNLYKRSIVFFRSLHSLVRLLPAYNLYRRQRKFNDDRDISIGYQFSSRNAPQHDEIPLDTSILDGDARNPTKSYTFTDITTPLGTFKLKVNYRRNCDFKVDDSEKDISARFVDMDEQFFTPTVAKYQQNYRTSPTRQRPSSMYDTKTSILSERAQTKEIHPISPTTSASTSNRYGYTTSDTSDPREIVQQRQRHSNIASRQSPRSSSPLNRDSRPQVEPVVSTSSSSSSRQTSIPAFSPFKSPSLSSSPQAENLLSGFKGASSVDKPKSSSGAESNSGSFGLKVEFSSSFDKYKGSPSRIDSGGTSMTRRWSRNSDHSSINLPSEMDDTDLEEFVRFVGVKQDLKLFQGRTSSTTSQLLDSTHQQHTSSPTSESSGSMGTSSYGTGSVYRSKKALSHFQNLRETHNTLSDSVTSSMMAMGSSVSDRDITTTNPLHEQQSEPMAIMSGGSPGSSSSSTGRSHQPVIPSPLHTEQHSASPVRIPRSLPPQLIHSPPRHDQDVSSGSTHNRHHSSQDRPANSSLAHISDTQPQKRQQSQRLTNPKYQQTITFSSYPQDRHHNDLRRFNIAANDIDINPYGDGHSDGDDEGTSDNRQIHGHRSKTTERGFSTTSDKDDYTYSMKGRQSRRYHGDSSNIDDDICSRGRDDRTSTMHEIITTSSQPTSTISKATSTSTIPTSSSTSGGGGVRTSILDDDDSLVFKMSELGGDPSMDSNSPPITSPILFNRPAITGSGQPMFTTKRLLETPTTTTTNLIRRTSSSDNIRNQQHVQSLPYQLDAINNTEGKGNSGSSSPSSNNSCKSEPATTTTSDPSKQHPPFFGRW